MSREYFSKIGLEGGLFCPDPPRIPGEKDRPGSTTGGEAGNARRSTTGGREKQPPTPDWGRGSKLPRARPLVQPKGGGRALPHRRKGGAGALPRNTKAGPPGCTNFAEDLFPPYRLGACRGGGKREGPPRPRLTKERANTKSKGGASLVWSLVFCFALCCAGRA
jgi:hypothetical protein